MEDYATLCSWFGEPEPENKLPLTPNYKTDSQTRRARRMKLRGPKGDKERADARAMYDKTWHRKEKNRIKNQKKKDGPLGYVYDFHGRIGGQLRKHINLLGLEKNRSKWEYFEFTSEEFENYFNKKFEEYNSMTDEFGNFTQRHPIAGSYSWANRLAWDIDHWKPFTMFLVDINESTSKEEQERILIEEVWALSNLQPMWSSWNRSKNNRYEGLYIPGK